MPSYRRARPEVTFSEHSAGRKKPPPHEVRSGGFLHVRGRSEKQRQGGPGQTTGYRSMCDSLIGNGSAKWQAQQ